MPRQTYKKAKSEGATDRPETLPPSTTLMTAMVPSPPPSPRPPSPPPPPTGQPRGPRQLC
ncbi:hypothetical protein DMN91_000254 [Ooceraea biroi]|uniref:Uncharacterized protein n=1 Tax=Ooceraea biroi TaxID=2015173 RepID=A0A3L8E2N8_OOCBI|nr:hypothetical protein DMN91_000254 [Ooceraea biroi]